MSSKRLSHELYVYINGSLVGILQQIRHELKFTYDRDWLHHHATPISLSMPLREASYRGDTVYNYFDNLLPDSVLIRKRIQARFQMQSNECFEILSYIGADCVGALQFLKEKKEIDVNKINAKKIDNKSIADLLKHYKTAPLGMQENSNFRISIAGAQEKTALLRYQNKWHIPEGATPTTHLIKLPIGLIPHANLDLSESIENEWLCLKILSAYGLATNEADIEYFDDVKALVVKRFDRAWEKDEKGLIRLPQEDMCQVLGVPSSLKYESDGGPGMIEIMKVLEGSRTSNTDRYLFMKTVFLFWVLGAIDGHAKNFSIFIEADGRYRLTPLYDVISAYPLVEKGQLQLKKIKMAMSVKEKNKHYHWGEIRKRHWLEMSNHCKFSAKSITEIMTDVFDNMDNVIETVQSILPKSFPSHIAESIFNHMKKVKTFQTK